MRQANAAGDFIELGVFSSGSTILLASITKQHHALCRPHLLDSWQGLPGLEDGIPGFVSAGQFLESCEDALRTRLDSFQLLDACRTYRGWIEDTLPALQGPFSLVRLDLDLLRFWYWRSRYAANRKSASNSKAVDGKSKHKYYFNV